jgi:hypothetical protein
MLEEALFIVDPRIKKIKREDLFDNLESIIYFIDHCVPASISIYDNYGQIIIINSYNHSKVLVNKHINYDRFKTLFEILKTSYMNLIKFPIKHIDIDATSNLCHIYLTYNRYSNNTEMLTLNIHDYTYYYGNLLIKKDDLKNDRVCAAIEILEKLKGTITDVIFYNGLIFYYIFGVGWGVVGINKLLEKKTDILYKNIYLNILKKPFLDEVINYAKLLNL